MFFGCGVGVWGGVLEQLHSRLGCSDGSIHSALWSKPELPPPHNSLLPPHRPHLAVIEMNDLLQGVVLSPDVSSSSSVLFPARFPRPLRG